MSIAFYAVLTATGASLLLAFICWSCFVNSSRHDGRQIAKYKSLATQYKTMYNRQQQDLLDESKRVTLLRSEIERLTAAADEASETINDLTTALRRANAAAIKARIDEARKEEAENA